MQKRRNSIGNALEIRFFLHYAIIVYIIIIIIIIITSILKWHLQRKHSDGLFCQELIFGLQYIVPINPPPRYQLWQPHKMRQGQHLNLKKMDMDGKAIKPQALGGGY